MIKCIQVTSRPDSRTHVYAVELASLSEDAIRQFLGVDEKFDMDSFVENFDEHADQNKLIGVTIELSLDTPWTFVSHTFIPV